MKRKEKVIKLIIYLCNYLTLANYYLNLKIKLSLTQPLRIEDVLEYIRGLENSFSARQFNCQIEMRKISGYTVDSLIELKPSLT